MARQGILLVLEEAERQSSKRIEPRGATASRRDKGNANFGIEAEQVRAGPTDIDRTFDPHRRRSHLAAVRDPDFVGEPLSNGKRQSEILDPGLGARTDSEKRESSKSEYGNLDGPPASDQM